MDVVGLRKLPVGRFWFPGDFQQVLESADVERLAESIDEIGEIHDPLVYLREDGHYEVIAGARRFAANMKLKRKSVTCKLVKVTEEEVTRIRLAENAHREHDPKKQKKLMDELVAEMTKVIAKKNPTVRLRGGGRPMSAAGMARKAIADQRGITVNSVRMQEWRAQKKREAEALGLTRAEYEIATNRGEVTKPIVVVPDLPPIKTLNVELTDDFVVTIVKTQKALEEARGKTHHATRYLKAALAEKLPVRAEEVERAIDALVGASVLLSRLVPWSLCAACKGIEVVQNECVTCRQTGYVTREEEGRMPTQLFNLDDPHVLYRGEFKPTSTFAETADDGMFGGLPE